mgnify:CR=1 FL=1
MAWPLDGGERWDAGESCRAGGPLPKSEELPG